MENKRNAYYKKYIADKRSNSSRRVTRQGPEEDAQSITSTPVGRKRRKQNDLDFVTKLRRANTADYEAIQLISPNGGVRESSAQHAPAPVFQQPTLDISTGEMTTHHRAALELLQPALGTTAHHEFSTQESSAPVFQQPTLDTSTDEMTTQHRAALELLQPALGTTAHHEFSTQESSAPVFEQPTLDTSTDEMTTQHRAALELLQPALGTTAHHEFSTQESSAPVFQQLYFINEGEGQRPVCLKFILNTLDIRQRFLHQVLSTSNEGSSKTDYRGSGVPANKTSPLLMQSVRDFIQELPAVPSHYCRKNSKKCYLPQEYRNLSNLYKIYKQKAITEKKSYVGEKVVKNIFFTEFNISFHVPRNDKCVKCLKYENSPGEFQEEKNNHMIDKEETYSKFKIHQQLGEHNDKVLCTTFDLQKVLNTPYGQSMLLYYSRKIAVYNLTFYESVTREGLCFLWNEVEGKRGANEVCTILAKYIKIVDERENVKHLLLYCDSCPGQNRNKTVLACIHKCLQKCKNIGTIQINYLLPGHTFMPVDSMHSVIEKSVTNTIVWAPSQWPTVCALARKVPKPYAVEVLVHEDFEGWDMTTEKYFKGNLTGKISRIRTATFKKQISHHFEVKYSMHAEAETETIQVVGKPELAPKKIYKSKLPISKKKFSDLEKLCNNKTIPAMYVLEYKLLPHAANVQDCLADTDLEDIQDNADD